MGSWLHALRRARMGCVPEVSCHTLIGRGRRLISSPFRIWGGGQVRMEWYVHLDPGKVKVSPLPFSGLSTSTSAGSRLREEVLARTISQLFRPVHHQYVENPALCKQNLMDVGVYNLPSDAREKPRGLAREWKLGLTSKMRLGGRKHIDAQDFVHCA